MTTHCGPKNGKRLSLSSIEHKKVKNFAKIMLSAFFLLKGNCGPAPRGVDELAELVQWRSITIGRLLRFDLYALPTSL